MPEIRPSDTVIQHAHEKIVLTRLNNCVISLISEGYLPDDITIMLCVHRGRIENSEDVKVFKPATLRGYAKAAQQRQG